MKNRELADVFSQMADLMEILDEDPFRVASYRKVGRVLEELTDAIEDIAAAGRLETLGGIGKSTAAKIAQFLATGRVQAHQELLGKVPSGVAAMLEIPGLGPKTAAKLWRQGGITTVEQLKIALASPEKLAGVPGMGAKKARQLLESMAFLDRSAGRALLGEASALAESLVQAIEAAKGAQRVVIAGSLRRGKETIGDIDLLCQAPAKAAGGIIQAFTRAPAVRRVLAAGETKGSVTLEGGMQADLRVVDKKSLGAAWMYFTGSKDHNVALRDWALRKKLKLNEYGLFRGRRAVAGASEDEVYAALGLKFIAPELREDRGEIAAAAEGKLPRLLSPKDIRGDMHMHTTASDGRNSLEEMIEACRARGYAYMVIADHSQSQVQARGLDAKRLRQQVQVIRRLAAACKDIWVMTGIEVDIFKDGSLDFPPDVLAELDFVTASPHSALSQDSAGATRRLIRAIEHPCVHCIGHPSGRLLNARPGMELDIQAVAEAAAANRVALEINADPHRLDLRDLHVRAAVEAGATLVINTDSHSVDSLLLMRYGVMTARRGWAEPKDVLNTCTGAELKKWLAKRR
ncbi:MAG: DNA polymerase/3'-5' exonuclease PolX [Phycisphaerae bacterium]|nr:DNA polymerase/3'-5' exonuclease PolX [Phycisphaerae bacterium]